MALIDFFVTKWMETKRLNVQPDRCVRTRNRFSSCHKCTEACPVSAISLSEGLKIEAEVCTECMQCTVSCPSEALYDEKYTQYFAEMQKRELIAFSCENDKSEEAHIKLGCLAQLDKALLIQAAMNSKSISIQFDNERCMACYKYDGKLQATLEKTINEVNSMLKEPVDVQYNEKPSSKMVRSYTRRELISFFSKKMTRNVVSPLLPDEEEIQNLRVSLEKGSMRTVYHRLLEKHQQAFKENQSSQHLQTVQLAVNGNCDGCKVCTHVCPTGALKFIETDLDRTITLDAQRCNGCMSCVDICKKNGIKIGHSLIELQTFLDKKPREIFMMEGKT